MAREVARRQGAGKTALPSWIRPQLTQLVKEPPDGPGWLHEIKFDGYRMHARLDHGAVRLLTRTGLDWTHKYPAIAAAVASLPAGQAYLDGELCGVRPDGTNGPGFVTPIAFEEANIPGVFAIGFDVYPRTEPRNDVSVHWNGVEYANVTMPDARTMRTHTQGTRARSRAGRRAREARGSSSRPFMARKGRSRGAGRRARGSGIRLSG